MLSRPCRGKQLTATRTRFCLLGPCCKDTFLRCEGASPVLACSRSICVTCARWPAFSDRMETLFRSLSTQRCDQQLVTVSAEHTPGLLCAHHGVVGDLDAALAQGCLRCRSLAWRRARHDLWPCSTALWSA